MSANLVDDPTRVPSRPMPRAPARERLLRAALEQFDKQGTLAATLEDIRGEAEVSVGALYHHFPDKTGLASALYVDLTRAFQEAFTARLRASPGAEEGVRAGVRTYLGWVSANRAAAAFLLGERPADDSALREQNRPFFAETMAWWQMHVHYGVLRDLPFDLINALWLGSAHEYARHWLAGRSNRVPATVADVLAEAAWQALRQEGT
ncbi:MAG: TetR/AcrR family transcriptional regulator [Solirubrobacteraceae bacterium]